MSWGAWSALLRTLRIPQSAGPDDPQIVIGPDVPAELMAYYAATGPVIAAQIYQQTSSKYVYLALVVDAVLDLPIFAVGTTQGGSTEEAYRVRGTDVEFGSALGAASGILFGSDSSSVPIGEGPIVFFRRDVDVRYDGLTASRGTLGGNIVQVESAGLYTVAPGPTLIDRFNISNVRTVEGRVYRHSGTFPFLSTDTTTQWKIEIRQGATLATSSQRCSVRLSGLTYGSWTYDVLWPCLATTTTSWWTTVERTSGAGTLTIVGAQPGGYVRFSNLMEDCGAQTLLSVSGNIVRHTV